MSSPKIFISHSSSDRPWAREFATAMRNRGADVWFDELDILPGDSIAERLEDALRKSDVVILPVTPETLADSNFYFELGAALSTSKRIIPIVWEGVDPSRLPQSLSSIRALKQRSPQETAEELVGALGITHDEAA